MTDTSLQIDSALFAEFLDESCEMLASVDEQFIQLEANPSDLAIIQAIFRPVHSIKGNSAFFGMTRVKQLAHTAENLLDMLRHGSLTVNPTVISILLKAVDELKAMLSRVRHGEAEVIDDLGWASIVDALEQLSKKGPATQAEAWEQIKVALEEALKTLPTGAAACKHALDTSYDLLRHVAPQPKAGGPGGLPAPAACLYEILTPPFEGTLPRNLANEVNKALQEMAHVITRDQAVLDEYAEMRAAHDTFAKTVGFDGLLREIMLQHLDRLTELKAWVVTPPPAPTEEKADLKEEAQQDFPAGQAPAPSSTQTAASEVSKTMRVSETHIDTFLSYVGELLVVGDMLGHLQGRVASELTGNNIVTDFRRINETFKTLSASLQKSIMSIRKVPVGPLLRRAPRIARDVASAKGKKIRVILLGEDYEVDKSHADILDAPLTHMVRNAADHGVEMPEIRGAAGKPEEGVITISVGESGEFIELRVSDDGGGLNLPALKDKAESMGLIGPGQALSEEAIVALLFQSGVSTASSVTDVSGRGVGMDVVHGMVEQAGGMIRVENTEGLGVTFRLLLPKTVTTQIMDGFAIIAGDQTLVLPMDCVRETLSIQDDEILSITGKGKCLSQHNRIIRILDLADILGINRKESSSKRRLVVVIEVKGQPTALLIDGVRGVQQVVVRPLEGLPGAMDFFIGGALLGDGSVAFIMEPGKIVAI